MAINWLIERFLTIQKEMQMNTLGAALLGTWKLDTFVHEIIKTGAKINIMGAHPNGFITFTTDGRVHVIITAEDRPHPKDGESISDETKLKLYQTLMAYAGDYEIQSENSCTFKIDCAWNQSWVGVELKRTYEINGDKLSIALLPQIGIDGNIDTAVLNWTKVGKS